jgi:hypothetical protein
MFLMGCNGGAATLPVTPEAPGYDVTRPDTEPSAGPSPELPAPGAGDDIAILPSSPIISPSPEPPVSGGGEPTVGRGNNSGSDNGNLDDEGHSPELGTMTLLVLSGLGAGASRLRRRKQ